MITDSRIESAIFSREIMDMATSYKKLWIILLDRKMKKKDLQKLAGLNHYQMAKLSRGEDITTDIVGQICKALGVKADDIMEFVDG